MESLRVRTPYAQRTITKRENRNCAGVYLAARFFAQNGGIDALEVLKWKELYDLVEDAIDGCEDVGNTLERIVLKNG